MTSPRHRTGSIISQKRRYPPGVLTVPKQSAPSNLPSRPLRVRKALTFPRGRIIPSLSFEPNYSLVGGMDHESLAIPRIVSTHSFRDRRRSGCGNVSGSPTLARHPGRLVTLFHVGGIFYQAQEPMGNKGVIYSSIAFGDYDNAIKGKWKTKLKAMLNKYWSMYLKG